MSTLSIQPVKLLSFRKDSFRGRGYPAYENHTLVGVHPGCSECNQYGTVPGYNDDGEYDYVDCPNCGGHGWATWIIPIEMKLTIGQTT